MADEEFEIDEDEELSLLETLDHVLDRGLVIAGEVTIAVADVDLIYLGLNLLLGSVETVERVLGERERRAELLGAGKRPADVPPGEEAEEARRARTSEA
jgi:hypothetical protein